MYIHYTNWTSCFISRNHKPHYHAHPFIFLLFFSYTSYVTVPQFLRPFFAFVCVYVHSFTCAFCLQLNILPICTLLFWTKVTKYTLDHFFFTTHMSGLRTFFHPVRHASFHFAVMSCPFLLLGASLGAGLFALSSVPKQHMTFL